MKQTSLSSLLFSPQFMERFKRDWKGASDERLVQQRNQTAWYTLIVNFLIFMAISAVYALGGQHLPLVLQIMFYVPLVVFFLLGIRKGGLAFTIPGIPESDETLDQPAAVRSLPWVVLVTTIVQPFFIDVLGAIHGYAIGVYPLSEALVRGLPSLLLSPFLAYWFAFLVKRANRSWLVLVALASLVNVINYGGKFIATYATGRYIWWGPGGLGQAYVSPTTSPIELMIVLASLWCVGVIVFYGRSMVKAGTTLPGALSGQKYPPLTFGRWLKTMLIWLIVPIIIVTVLSVLILNWFS